jgi:pilus assembly protein FimV
MPMMKGDHADTQERRMARDVNVGPAAEKKLERYGVWVKVEPRDVTSEPGGFELTDLEPQEPGAAPDGAPALTDEEETLLDELETGVGHEVAAGTRDELESLDEQIAPADEELPELELEDAVDVPLADDAPGAGRFDDLEALTDDAASPSAAGAHPPEVLSRIELELRSIRSDLAALKQELADLRRPAATARAAGRATEPAAGTKPVFFEEEEDDTIALTGDELDNILNTADITEEAAEVPPAATGPAEEVDILSYEEPAPAAAPRPAAAPDVMVEEPVEELEEVTDLDLEVAGDEPAELVLEDAGLAATADVLPSLDLEPIPEIETVGEADLEELPADEETVSDADLLADLEEVPAIDAEPGAAFDEVDLKALGDTTDAGHEAILSTEDLAAADLAELEAVAEDVIPAGEAGIEIDFEPAAGAAAGPAADDEAPLDVEEIEALEAVEDLEDVTAVDAAIEEHAPAAAAPAEAPRPARPAASAAPSMVMNEGLKNDLRNVLGVIDELLDALPEKKIREFAKSEHFAVYKKLFDDLGLSKPE